jgi:redox-sensitive bicupin YhaK (pirin superfamily)
MVKIRRSGERGHINHGWLNTYHTFSFADYYDPEWMGFRSLRVINDDIVSGGMGFGAHPHRDMEIITYVLSGALEHKDSMGNGRIIRPGEFQYMAAGTGVTHSEFNPSPAEPVHLLQIWIMPDQKGLPPAYAEKSALELPSNQFHLISSKTGRGGSISINQDADLHLARMTPGGSVAHNLAAQRHAWVHVAEGEAVVNGQSLQAGDAAIVSEEKAITIQANSDSQILLFDLA